MSSSCEGHPPRIWFWRTFATLSPHTSKRLLWTCWPHQTSNNGACWKLVGTNWCWTNWCSIRIVGNRNVLPKKVESIAQNGEPCLRSCSYSCTISCLPAHIAGCNPVEIHISHLSRPVLAGVASSIYCDPLFGSDRLLGISWETELSSVVRSSVSSAWAFFCWSFPCSRT